MYNHIIAEDIIGDTISARPSKRKHSTTYNDSEDDEVNHSADCCGFDRNAKRSQFSHIDISGAAGVCCLLCYGNGRRKEQFHAPAKGLIQTHVLQEHRHLSKESQDFFIAYSYQPYIDEVFQKRIVEGVLQILAELWLNGNRNPKHAFAWLDLHTETLDLGLDNAQQAQSNRKINERKAELLFTDTEWQSAIISLVWKWLNKSGFTVRALGIWGHAARCSAHRLCCSAPFRSLFEHRR